MMGSQLGAVWSALPAAPLGTAGGECIGGLVPLPLSLTKFLIGIKSLVGDESGAVWSSLCLTFVPTGNTIGLSGLDATALQLRERWGSLLA